MDDCLAEAEKSLVSLRKEKEAQQRSRVSKCREEQVMRWKGHQEVESKRWGEWETAPS